MRSVAGILALVAGTSAAATGAELFDRLDRDASGALSAEELEAPVREGEGWIAIDRDEDGRVSREEFTATTASPTSGQSQAQHQSQAQGYSARRLIGTPVRDDEGARLGKVTDILVRPDGGVSGIVLDDDHRVDWGWVRMTPEGGYATVPAESASAGGTSGGGGRDSGIWRVSELLGDTARFADGRTYAQVEDLVISPRGTVSVIVVDAGPAGARGPHAYAWPRDGELPDPRPFDYRAAGVLAPR